MKHHSFVDRIWITRENLEGLNKNNPPTSRIGLLVHAANTAPDTAMKKIVRKSLDAPGPMTTVDNIDMTTGMHIVTKIGKPSFASSPLILAMRVTPVSRTTRYRLRIMKSLILNLNRIEALDERLSSRQPTWIPSVVTWRSERYDMANSWRDEPSCPAGKMAGTHGNRTHQEPVSRPLTGFEDQAGHQPRTRSRNSAR